MSLDIWVESPSSCPKCGGPLPRLQSPCDSINITHNVGGMWTDWDSIMAETVRAILETDCHPQALKDAKYNLEIYDKQKKGELSS